MVWVRVKCPGGGMSDTRMASSVTKMDLTRELCLSYKRVSERRVDCVVSGHHVIPAMDSDVMSD